VSEVVNFEEVRMEKLAKIVASNFGRPRDLWCPAEQQWIVRNGELTEFGVQFMKEHYVDLYKDRRPRK
jgi:hypothetical protein